MKTGQQKTKLAVLLSIALVSLVAVGAEIANYYGSRTITAYRLSTKAVAAAQRVANSKCLVGVGKLGTKDWNDGLNDLLAGKNGPLQGAFNGAKAYTLAGYVDGEGPMERYHYTAGIGICLLDVTDCVAFFNSTGADGKSNIFTNAVEHDDPIFDFCVSSYQSCITKCGGVL